MAGGYVALGHEEADVHSDSFDVVYSAHHDYVHGLVYALIGNAQDAEDVTQDVFLSAYRALPTYQPERASMRTWLTKLAVNACRMHRRRNLLRKFWQHNNDDPAALEVVDLSLLGAPEDQALQSEARRTLVDALSKLRHEHRSVLVLHYYLDLSCQEIASILGCPEGTVYSRLYYARRTVQAYIERHSPRLSESKAMKEAKA
jgi:RNA polymerase sigma-70 factor (ECF subfamily)